MQFEDLRVERIVVHEVLKRDVDRAAVPPVLAEELENLDAEAMGAFRLRVTEVLSPGSQTLEMAIKVDGPGSFLEIVGGLVGATDDQFLHRSKAIAHKLAQAQIARRIPGGLIVVFSGSIGTARVPFVAVIKAETTAGFRRSVAKGKRTVEFLKNIFLTPTTKLYKVGMMVQRDTEAGTRGWEAHIFDNNISASHRESAAAYFYDGFLGCAFPADGAYETERFFDLTKSFIKQAHVAPEKKRDLTDSLFVFVRDEQAATFTSEDFNKRFVPADLRDAFTGFMKRKQFRETSIVRDTSGMGARLRRRSYAFGKDILLSGPPSALKDDVKINPGPGDKLDEQWTMIAIKRPFAGEK